MADVADIPMALLVAELLGLAEAPDASAEERVATDNLELGVAESSDDELVLSGAIVVEGRGKAVEASTGPEAVIEPEAGAAPPPALAGGGTALEGSLIAPTPQGIG